MTNAKKNAKTNAPVMPASNVMPNHIDMTPLISKFGAFIAGAEKNKGKAANVGTYLLVQLVLDDDIKHGQIVAAARGTAGKIRAEALLALARKMGVTEPAKRGDGFTIPRPAKEMLRRILPCAAWCTKDQNAQLVAYDDKTDDLIVPEQWLRDTKHQTNKATIDGSMGNSIAEFNRQTVKLLHWQAERAPKTKTAPTYNMKDAITFLSEQLTKTDEKFSGTIVQDLGLLFSQLAVRNDVVKASNALAA